MNCPYCGKEMKSGKILSAYVLRWKEEDEELPHDWMDRPLEGRKEISSKDTTFWNHTVGLPPQYSAYHCPDCQKFIFDGELI